MDDINKVIQLDIASDMRDSFLDYSMSVIVSRALPDARDGMKPVHRRILHGMNEQGMYSDKPYKKSARIVGDVMGKYHPHGDSSIYEAMVRMAQDFSYRYPLVQGHGNFGSMDGDGAAAMRYTEARMSKISMELIRDINKDTVDFVDNYDGEEKEPSVLPAKFPNLIVNGSMGIAVGMATNIPPHNLNETIDAALAVIKNPEITVMELMENHIFGPDFPTGGVILGRSGIKSAFETGKGSIITRAKVNIEEKDNGKSWLIFNEIPYQVNKSTLVKKIADLVREKMIEGITDLRDESNRDGVRIVIELRKDVQAEVVLNQLYRLTPLQSSFGVNFLALVDGAPKQLSIKEALEVYIKHQIEVIERRTRFDLKKAEDRAHILEGLRIALDHIDEIITLIRNSKDDEEARNGLMSKFELSEIQAKAILEMQLRRLTGLQREKIEAEYNELIELIKDLKDILANHERVLEIICNELEEIKEKYGDERRTEISDQGIDIEDEDLIPVEDVVISMTATGYIKRLPTDTYRTQNRGGRGVKGMTMNEDDIVDILITMSTHDYLLLFTNKGKVYRMKGYKIPAGSRTSKGLPVVNLLNLASDEKICALVPEVNREETKYLFFVTRNGIVKRVNVTEFESIRQNGKIAITLKDEDELVTVKGTSGECEVIIAGSNGKAVRFNENNVRPMGRTASGVKGFNIDGSYVVGAATNNEGKYLLSVSENGYGKRSEIVDYRLTSRGTKGVKTINITEKTGNLVAVRSVNGDEDAMIITNEGIIIRISLENVGVYGRNTQGVKLINVAENEAVARIAIVKAEDEENEEASESNEEVVDSEN
ncbi:DNA gyrase subunit A [Breznakia sp. PF5-3]|uniref:DNA gyrase subunit A n=1 Tax=unclassified Breznakia TaxID=2623764 RepID=UPI0024065EDB|nr:MULTISPECIES: DNA gyrase subunit A [unclassified Breznakia]MDF9824327.1 DNA gyrase subunit A [Breznakia sp. PM6-1]MDF9835082.1 DNA gyrase subunit A [Breznakia sp. PF5-3]MDF9838454.1 DNA gyrase subunit A [Breznakia sp. PFB2-8]MDF9860512.1 DNA gyrase subunit A [Breznakia sp. PH5-24]